VGRHSFFVIGGSEFFDSVAITVKLAGNERISFRTRSNDEKFAGDMGRQDFVDRPKLLAILTTILQFPFRSEEDFTVVDGPSGMYEGVRVLSGTIRSAYRASRKYYEDGAKDANLAWYDEVQLFITDSEPQYFCVCVQFHEDAKAEKAEPEKKDR
jgi:hypothetical protein